jgi:hypothetical protein
MLYFCPGNFPLVLLLPDWSGSTENSIGSAVVVVGWGLVGMGGNLGWGQVGMGSNLRWVLVGSSGVEERSDRVGRLVGLVGGSSLVGSLEEESLVGNSGGLVGEA